MNKIRVIMIEFVYSIKTRRRFNSYSKRTVRVSTSFTLLGSLSNSVFERQTLTGSGRFASLGSDLVQTLG